MFGSYQGTNVAPLLKFPMILDVIINAILKFFHFLKNIIEILFSILAMNPALWLNSLLDPKDLYDLSHTWPAYLWVQMILLF